MNPRIRAIVVVAVSVLVGGSLAFVGVRLLEPNNDLEVAPVQRDISQIVSVKDPPPAVAVSEERPDVGGKQEKRGSDDGCGADPPFTQFGTLTAGGFGGGFPTYIPSRYDPEEPHIVLLLFHDDSQDAESFMKVSGFVEIAEQLSFVIIAPQDPAVMAWTIRADASVARDALFAAGEQLCVDSSRVYAVGFGAGGRVVEELPCIMEVAGIATASYRSTDKDVVCKPPQPVPYIHMAPLKDEYSPVEGGIGCGGIHSPIPLADKEKMWRERNECGDRRSRWYEHKGTRCYTWPCTEPFASCHVNGGRGWPGTKRRIFDFKRCDGKPAELPYAETIWQFFARGPK